MSWVDRILGLPPTVEEAPAPVVEAELPPIASTGNETMDKINFHVRRFTLALEQCKKGPEREAELRRNLDYWLARKAAEEMRSAG